MSEDREQWRLLDEMYRLVNKLEEKVDDNRDRLMETTGRSGRNGRIGRVEERLAKIEATRAKKVSTGGLVGGGAIAGIVELIRAIVSW